MDHDLDLHLDGPALTAALTDIASVSGAEGPLADAIERELRRLPQLTVTRHGNTLVARTELGRKERVVLAGHLDTVPHAANFPSLFDVERTRLTGVGTSDMKAGVAVQLRLAATLDAPSPRRDLRVLRVRGGRGRAQRAVPAVQERPRAARRPVRGAARAKRRGGRGRLPGHPAGRDHGRRGAGAHRQVLDGAERDPRGRRDPADPARLGAAAAGRRRPRVPRGPERGRDLRRRRRQRGPRRVRGHGQLPLRPRPLRAARPRRTSATCSPAGRWRSWTSPPAPAPA